MNTLQTPVGNDDHVSGNKSGDAVLVEYGDYQCSHCGIAYSFIKRLLKEFKDVKFVFRNFPLREAHPHALIAAQAAEAAGLQDKFWEMHDNIYENQDQLSNDMLIRTAKKIGLDIDQFTREINDNRVINKIDSDVESGLRSGVNGTPTFFLNKNRLDSYDETYESLADAVKNGVNNR